MPAMGHSASAPKIKLGTDVRAAIEKIQGENEALKQDLARESRQSRLTQVMNSNQGGEVQRLQMEADMYLRKIEAERRKIEQLDYKIATAQRTIIEQRQKMGGINASKENHDMISKQIRILENRLDKALQKFNESLAMNKQLREQIDNLRKERVVFDGIYKKLEKDLHEKKKEMAAIIEDSKVAYQRSDRAMGEMVALKQQVDKEKSDFEREWRDLGKLMEQDRQLREQLRRQSREEHLAGGARRSGAPGDGGTDGGFEGGAEGGEGSGGAGDFADGKDKAPLALSHDKVVSYEETFAKIREATGVEQGRKRVIQRLFNVGVLEAMSEKKASTL